jgi:hypothetical protein
MAGAHWQGGHHGMADGAGFARRRRPGRHATGISAGSPLRRRLAAPPPPHNPACPLVRAGRAPFCTVCSVLFCLPVCLLCLPPVLPACLACLFCLLCLLVCLLCLACLACLACDAPAPRALGPPRGAPRGAGGAGATSGRSPRIKPRAGARARIAGAVNIMVAGRRGNPAQDGSSAPRAAGLVLSTALRARGWPGLDENLPACLPPPFLMAWPPRLPAPRSRTTCRAW